MPSITFIASFFVVPLSNSSALTDLVVPKPAPERRRAAMFYVFPIGREVLLGNEYLNMAVTVSVIIPVFNAHDLIGDAITSVLEQTRQDFEIVVCDDKSTDATISVVESFARRDPRVRLLRNTVNHGVSYARNRAIEASTGDWIAILDADDRFHSRRLEALLELAQENDADLVCDDLVYISPSGRRTLGTAIPSGEVTEATELSAASYIAKTSRLAFRYGYLNPIIRKEFIDKYALRYNEELSTYEDFDFMARCLIKGAKCILTNQALYFYRLTPGSLSRGYKKEWLDKARPVDLALLGIPEVQSDPDLVSALLARRTYFEKIEKFHLIVNSVKSGKLRHAWRELATNLPLLPFFMQIFQSKIRKRVQALLWKTGDRTIIKPARLGVWFRSVMRWAPSVSLVLLGSEFYDVLEGGEAFEHLQSLVKTGYEELGAGR